MDLTWPIRAVVPSLDGPVLQVLSQTTHPLTGRQIHALARTASNEGVRKVLMRLADQGIVTVSQAGGAALLYTLNRQHLAAPAIDILTRLRSTLIARMRGEISSWSVRPVHASLFGSAARGDGDADSDLDVLLIRVADIGEDDPAWQDQVAALGEKGQAWTGNHVQVYELDTKELRRHIAAGEGIVEEWRRDGILLAGQDLDRVTRRRRQGRVA